MNLITPQPLLNRFNIAIVVARFNQEITDLLLQGALTRLKELGFDSDQISVVWVPGAVEIPITAQRLARTEKFIAIICLGAVIYGETKHFDYVCQQVSQGCQHVALTHNLPVLFGVLTTDTLEQARERAGGKKGNMGAYTVDSAYELVSVLDVIGD